MEEKFNIAWDRPFNGGLTSTPDNVANFLV
jgi:hypothetical protein